MFLLLSYVYHSLLSEPPGIFLSGSAYRQCLRGYLKALLGIQAILTVFGLVLLGGSAAIVYALGKADGLPGALAGVAIASPCILFFWLLRRAYYMNLAPARAAMGADLLRAGDGRFVCCLREGTGFAVLGVSADGDRCVGHGILSAVASEQGASARYGEGADCGAGTTLGIRALGAGGFGGYLDSVLHVLPAGERVFGDGAGWAVAGADESVLPMEQSYTALSIFFLPMRRGYAGKRASPVRGRWCGELPCCLWWERWRTGRW